MYNLKELLKNLAELPGAPGFEEPVIDYIFSELSKDGLGKEDMFVDNMGNGYVRIKGTDDSAPVIHIDAHADEPCFMVQYIDENGMVYIAPLGYIAENILMGQRMSIITENGPVTGGFGVKSYHLSNESDRASQLQFDNIWIDIGAASRESAEKAGVKPGLPVVFAEPFIDLLDNNVMSKAFDNRAGCAIALATLKELIKKPAKSTVFATFTVQEELILRGSRTVFEGFKKFFGKIPDMTIVYDISLCGDVPMSIKNKAPVELGKGPAIKLYDKSAASHYAHVTPKKIVKLMEDSCKKMGLKYQYDFLYGSSNTDIFALQDIGVLAGGISFPCRYTHSSVEIVNMDDLRGSVDLTVFIAQNAWSMFSK